MNKQVSEPVATLEDLKGFIFPEGYALDLVTEGTEKVDKETGSTIYINRMHAVAETGKVMCNCKLDPRSVFVFVSVSVPPDFGGLWCSDSQIYMRNEIDRIQKEGK